MASAVLVEALKADYWKPVQAGDLEVSDTHGGYCPGFDLGNGPDGCHHPDRHAGNPGQAVCRKD